MKRALPFLVIGGVALLLVAISLATPRPYDPRLRAERAGDRAVRLRGPLPPPARLARRARGGGRRDARSSASPTPRSRARPTSSSRTTSRRTPAEADRLLRFVRQGNTLVVAAQYVGGPLFEALGEPASSSPYVPDTLGADAPLSEIYKQSERDSLDTHGVYMDDRGGPAFDAFEFDETDDGSEDDTGGGVLGADTLYVGREARAFPVPLDGGLIYGLDSTAHGPSSPLTDLSGGVPTAVAIAEGRGRVVLASTPLAFTNAAIAGQGQGAAYLAGHLRLRPAGPPRAVGRHPTSRSATAARRSRSPCGRPRCGGRCGSSASAPCWACSCGAGAGSARSPSSPRRRTRSASSPAPSVASSSSAATARGLAARKRRHLEDALRRQLGIADADLSDATARRAAARAGVPEDDALAPLRAPARPCQPTPTRRPPRSSAPTATSTPFSPPDTSRPPTPRPHDARPDPHTTRPRGALPRRGAPRHAAHRDARRRVRRPGTSSHRSSGSRAAPRVG